MGTKQFDSATDLITFTRASGGTALRKISYGSELVTNGDFATDTDWTLGDGWTISGGVAVGTNTFRELVSNTATVIAGRTYIVTFEITSYTAGRVKAKVGSTLGTYRDSVGVYTETITATNTDNARIVRSDLNFTGSIDNVSVKEVTFDQPDGTLQLFNHPDNVPRIEYDADGTVKGLLIEEARTNLLTYSEDFSNAAYNKTDCSVTSNATTAPDGTTTADKLSFATTNNSFHFISKGITMGAESHTVSAFFKAGEVASASIFLSRGGNVGGSFNLSTGVATASGTGNTANMVDVGNGWYHCSVTNDGSTDIDNSIRLGIGNGALGSFVGVIGQGIFAWGAQLEAGAFPTSYIPTTGATATRAADVASIPVDNFGYNDDAGTVVVTASVERSVTKGGTGLFTLNTILNSGLADGGGMGSFYRANNTLGINVWDSSGTPVLDKTPTGDVDNRTITLAFAIKEGDFAIVTDYNQTVITQASGQLPAPITVLQLGKWGNDTDILCGHIKSIKYYPRRLSNTQLQELTT